MKRFTCGVCGHDVYFDNTRCVTCGSALGYAPDRGTILAAPAPPFEVDGVSYRRCANAEYEACNWLVTGADTLCRSCRHNRTIPNLATDDALRRWRAIEAAKRLLFYALIAWRLPAPTKDTDPERGLAFDFLADETQPDGSVAPVLTGHASGLITINIAEGDDAERERRRTEMGEPYRTLVGHFRHEVGHYYWDRLVRDGGELDACRALFGDEREDYAAALARHYENGPPDDWRERHISAYAAAHPWEDFAETFAHYAHTVDVLETARSFGVAADGAAIPPEPYGEADATALIDAMVPVSLAVNALNRSMGQPDLYPFVLSDPVRSKLAFIHRLIAA